MKTKILTVLFLLCCTSAAFGQQTPQKQVETFFSALLDNRLDLALKAFGKEPKFSESQKAVLQEYKVQDPTPVGRCENHLKELGKVLASYNEIHSGYPPRLEALVPNSLKVLPTCPDAPKKPYTYERRDQYYYLLSCPSGHGRTPGFPKYSPIDGVLPNPNLKLLNYYKILGVREENGLTKIKVVGSTPQGNFDRDFVFTPSGGFVAGDFSKEVERLLRGMTESRVPRATKLDPASLLLGVAVFSDQELVRAAHCRLQVEKLYYKILGVQTRLGEKSFDVVAKHIDEIPKCPTSGKPLQVKKTAEGKTLIFCPGASHIKADLKANQPSREF